MGITHLGTAWINVSRFPMECIKSDVNSLQLGFEEMTSNEVIHTVHTTKFLQSMFDRKVLLWTTGGFAAGCLLGAYAAKSFLEPSKRLSDDITLQSFQHIALSQNGSVLTNENVTTFSGMTLLLGSPTASGAIDMHEYPFYAASGNYPDLDGNRSLMARYLTQEVYEELYRNKTSSGFDIDSCIQTGIDNPDKVSCGVVAGDEECYDIFAEIFDPVITDRHRGFRRSPTIHKKQLSADGLTSAPFDAKYVKSTHFLIGRCLTGFRFPPCCSRAERKHAENLLKATLESFQGYFAGTYIHLSDLSKEQRHQLPDILQSIADRPTSSTLQSSSSVRDWPNGRGIYYNKESNLFAWTNREDHLRVMYRDRELDFIESFKRFCDAVKELEENMSENGLEFAFHQDYGYLLTCPSGIGTALRAGVHIKLPNLLRDQRFRTILKNSRLHMGAEDQEMLKQGYVDVYNMDRLGYTEAYLVQHVADAVHLLIQMEKRLEKHSSISDLITIQDNGLED